MSQSKKLAVLAAGFVILCFLAFLYHLHRIPPKSKTYFQGLKSEEISRLEISKKGQTVDMEKTGADWQIVSPLVFPASRDFVKEVCDRVKDMSIISLISTNEKKHPDFKLDAEGGIELKIFKGKEKILDGIFGKMADYEHVYFRFPDKKDIYLVFGPATWMLERDVKAWRERAIVKVERVDIEKITIIRPSDKTELFEKGGIWRLSDPDKGPEADNVEVDDVFRMYSCLSADDFVDDKKTDSEMGFKKPLLTVSGKLKSGAEETVIFGNLKKDVNQCYVRKAGQETVFLVNCYAFNTLNKSAKDFQKKNRPLPQPVK